MSAKMQLAYNFTDPIRYSRKRNTYMIVLIAIAFLPLYMSAVARLLYPASVTLFLERWSNKNLFLLTFLGIYWLGPSIITVFGAGLRTKAGIKEALWIDLVMLVLIVLYVVIFVKSA